MAASNKSTKKRSASSQAGPKPKKVQLEKPGKSEKKRSRPVTAPVVEEGSASDSEDGLNDIDDGEDKWIDEDETADVPMDEDVAESTPATPAQPKDPNGMS